MGCAVPTRPTGVDVSVQLGVLHLTAREPRPCCPVIHMEAAPDAAMEGAWALRWAQRSELVAAPAGSLLRHILGHLPA